MNIEKSQPLLNALNWRYATKIFDLNKIIPADIWAALEQSLVLTPSSYGLQPYRFLRVDNSAKRAELLPHSWNQQQVVDCSHYVVFTSRKVITEADVDRFLQRISQVRGVSVESLSAYRGMMLGDIVNGPRSKMVPEWAARQAYIALGSLMTCAAVLGVDACPMEGLDPAAYDRILDLEHSGYQTVVACALGYRAATDKYASLPKVRFAPSDLIQRV